MGSEIRNQLAVMIRNTQWSYAIFWTVSSTHSSGVIEWGEGYYNGQRSRTAKTTKSKDDNAIQNLGLQRSEQLREAYKLLLEGKGVQGRKRNPSSLTMEDLSDLEWYYLVCMSFTFKFGQCLPGKAYATKQQIWLCGAQTTDNEVFTRALLAKSASVQTVICFPYLGGVIELGSTELISEDLKLIERILQSVGEELLQPASSQLSSSTKYQSHTVPTADQNDDGTRSLPTLQMILDQELEDVVIKSTPENLSMNSLEIDSNFDHWKNELPVNDVPLYELEEDQQFTIFRSIVPSVIQSPDEVEVRLNELEFDMDLMMDEIQSGVNKAFETDVLQVLNIEVSLVNDEVSIEMHCPWREYLLLDIIKVLNDLNLDTYNVQSSTTVGGALCLSLKCKVREAGFVTEMMIKQALRRTISMC